LLLFMNFLSKTDKKTLENRFFNIILSILDTMQKVSVQNGFCHIFLFIYLWRRKYILK